MSAVFIPTRKRLHNLQRILPLWIEQDMPIFIVPEKHEAGRHKEFLRERHWEKKIEVISPPSEDRGIGYVRNFIVKRADKLGFKRIIMSDDDARPVSDKMEDLCKFPGPNSRSKKRRIGQGACFSYYGLLLGNDTIRDTSKPQLVPGGTGYITFALDVEAALELGNYNTKLHTFWEDSELIREAMASFGTPWYIHTGIWAASIGKRHMPGGLDAFAGKQRAKQEKDCHWVVYDRWGPEYISHPSKRPACRWKKMLNAYVPHWEELERS